MPGRIYLAQRPPGASASPLPVHWGVDSWLPAFVPPSDSSRLDALVAEAGRTPEFWGRYIGTGTIGNLTQREVECLHNRNCKVLLIYRDTAMIEVIRGYPEAQPPIPPIQPISSYADGEAHAQRALDDIVNRGLLLPGGKRVYIWADIEFKTNYPGGGWPNPTDEFFRGWAAGLAASPYGAGVYVNTKQPAHATPLCCAYNHPDTLMRVPGSPALVWTNQPNKCGGADCDEYRKPDVKMPPYAPWSSRCNRLQAPCSPLIPYAGIYQYAIDISIPNGVPVDYDLADEVGFRRMWATRWEAVKVVGTIAIATMFPSRGIDTTSGGRIYLVWNDDTNSVWRNAYSDDGGDSWSTPTGMSWLGEALCSMVTKGTAMHLFTRGHPTSPTRAITRYKWDAGSWTGASTIYGPLANPLTVGFPRAARARDHSGQSCVWRSQYSDANGTHNEILWAPVTDSGAMPSEVAVAEGDLDTPGTPPGIPPNYALYYNESHEPVLLWATGGSSPAGRKKTRSGGSWGSVSSFDAADMTLLESVVLQDAGNLSDYSPGLPSNGDIHSFRDHAGGNTLDLDYRWRVSGSWTEDTLDLSGLISGSADSTSLLRKSVPIMLGSRLMTVFYTAGSTHFAIWFAYKDL